MSEGIIGIIKKAKPFTDWLDDVPGVPATICGLVIGTLIPTKLLLLAAAISVIYAVIRFVSK